MWQFCDKISQCSIISKVHRATLSEQISPVRKKNTLQIPQTWQDQLLYSQILNLEHLMINGHTHGPTSWFFCRRYYHIALPYLFDIWVVFGYFEDWLYLPVGTLHFPKPPPENFLFNMMNTLKFCEDLWKNLLLVHNRVSS